MLSFPARDANRPAPRHHRRAVVRHACAALADVTKVYEWREASGVLSFSQEPPPPKAKGVTVRQIDTETFTPAERLAVRLRLSGLDAEQQADAKRFRDQVADAEP